MIIFIDTNVVLDFFLAREPFYKESKKIFKKVAFNEITAFVSSVTVVNSFYTISKEKDKAIAFKAVADLLKIIEITTTDKEVLEKALLSSFKDFEDAVQNESAIAENLDAIITRNTKDFANSSLKIYTPTEFLQSI